MRGWFGVLLLALVACGDPFAPVGRVERFTPPPVYREWYTAMERCAGRTGDFDAVRWFVVDSLASPDAGMIAGSWTAPHTIRLRRRWENQWPVITHESLHDILGTSEHPDPPFHVCA